MYDLPDNSDLEILPDLFTNEHIPIPDRIVRLHLFSYQTDWFFCEYNPAIQNLFGMVVVNANFDNAKWGFFTMPEIEKISREIMEVHWNKNFTPRAVRNLRPLRVHFEGRVRIYT